MVAHVEAHNFETSQEQVSRSNFYVAGIGTAEPAVNQNNAWSGSRMPPGFEADAIVAGQVQPFAPWKYGPARQQAGTYGLHVCMAQPPAGCETLWLRAGYFMFIQNCDRWRSAG